MKKSSIRPERVRPEDISINKLIFSCEDCSHFNLNETKCTLGLNCSPHLKQNQLTKFNMSGEMLFCRFLEIE